MSELERLRAENEQLVQAMALWPTALTGFREAAELTAEGLIGFVEGFADSPELQQRAAAAVAPIAMSMASHLELLSRRLAQPRIH
ncbi:MAG TPA: hypothetical protein VGU24_15190 [Microvirga sp.]|jgi:hypothetical protein|nr:hypothetical protein [Microvirga sp.]